MPTMLPGYIAAQFEHQNLVADQISSALDDLYQGGRESITRFRVEARLSALNNDWQEFAGNHKALGSDIAELAEDVRVEARGDSYYSQNLFRTTREIFLDSFEKMTTLLDTIQTNSSRETPRNPPSQSSLSFYHRLPRLELPTFNGDHIEWLTFRDMFSSLVVNNESLSPVEKLYYLRSHLRDSASLLLKHTPLTDNNFQKAWDSLTSYYDNKRVLVDSMLHSLFSTKCLQHESAKDLEELYTTFSQIIRSLEVLGQPVNHWDSILVYFTIRCLDPNTVRAWELELGSSTECPKWSQLGDFIVNRMRSLQALDRASSSKLNQPQSGSNSKNSSTGNRQPRSQSFQHNTSINPVIKSCPVCDSDHLIYKCPEYGSKAIERRMEIIRKKGLCFNCLGSHLLTSCPSTRRCLKCGKRHHTSIHGADMKPSVDKSSGIIPSPAIPSSSSESAS